MRNIIVCAFVWLLAISCSNFEQNDKVNQLLTAPEIIYAEFELPDSRTYVENGMDQRWNRDDEISYFSVNYNLKYRFKGETGADNGAFEKITEDVVTGVELDNNYAVYPYKESTSISADGVISFDMPAEQSYAENSFGLGDNTMVAVTSGKDDNVLRFKNVGGYLNVQLYGDDVTVKSIELKGNREERIAGKATIISSYGGYPVVEMATTAYTTITLDCGEGVKLSNNADSPTIFWFVLPTLTFSEGFSIVVTDINGQIFKQTTNNSYTVERNKIQPMKSLKTTFETPEAPDTWKIYYTATAKIEPHGQNTTSGSGNRFGANIVSNEYDETTGNGIITFDGPVTKIGYMAFAQLNALTSVVVPDAVTEIEEGAFETCFNLKSVTIGQSVNSIAPLAFYDSPLLNEFNGKFATSDKRCLVIDGVLNVFAPAGLQSYNIPQSVTAIGKGAFMDAELVSITIPGHVKTIGHSAFMSCRALKSATIESGTTEIGEQAFCWCDLLTDVNMGSVEIIGEAAFDYCGSLESVVIPASVKEIRSYAFSCSNLLTVYCEPITPPTLGEFSISSSRNGFTIYVPGEALEIYKQRTDWQHYWPFIQSGSSGENSSPKSNEIWYTTTTQDIEPLYNEEGFLARVISNTYENGVGIMTFDRDIEVIGYTAFANSQTLQSVTIPGSVKIIGEAAFYSCLNLNSVTLSSQLEVIDNDAFAACWNLSTIKLPSSLRIISMGAFRNSGLTEVTIPYGVEEIRDGAFGATPLTSVKIPGSVVILGQGAFSRSGLVSVSIGSGVTSIEPYTFNECIELKEVSLGSNVKHLGEYAFNATSIEEITIPQSVETIGHAAFCQYYSSGKTLNVRCLPTTPPTAIKSGEDWWPFNYPIDGDNVKIFVPESSVGEYKAADGWNIYSSKIFAIPF